jgi:murein DD-endopeptidase MepM/ murein hydrolase activator NlpD
MDDKTVIAPRAPQKLDTAPEKQPEKQPLKPPEKLAGKSKRKKKGAKPIEENSAPKSTKASNAPVIFFGLMAIVLVTFGSALTSIYYFSKHQPAEQLVTQDELNAELISVSDASSEAEDEALVKAAIQPRIINLSGDPIIVRQLSNAPRQLVRLDRPPQKKAASQLGLLSDVYRIKDTLDEPNPGLQAGLAGSQEDIAVLSNFEPPPSSDKSVGFSAIETSSSVQAQQFREFAQRVKIKVGIAEALQNLGIGKQASTNAETAFASMFGKTALAAGDKFAVRALTEPQAADTLVPVQVSIYAEKSLVGTIALDDLENYARAADPWADQNIFETQLLPQDINPEDRLRLLDAIYAAALRNKLPPAVTGEAIMLLSRAQDLEQKTQPGDTITIVYSPAARDSKSGLGRIVYINIGRTTGNLECYAFQSQAGQEFDCVSADGQSSIPENGMVLPVNGTVVAQFGMQKAEKDAKEAMNFGVDWSAAEGTPVLAAFAGDVQSISAEGAWGTVVRLSHADNKSTMYAYLQRVEPGLIVGTKVKAGQTIGYVGTPASSRAPRLHFELRENDVPVDPIQEVQADAGAAVPSGGSGAVDQFVHRIITIESANRCGARNPLSTAVGLGQFIEGTWMTTVRIHRPDLLSGRSRQQVLDLRLDCNLSRAMTTAFTRDNAAVLRRSGASVTPGNLYLAHFLGVGGAVKVLTGNTSRSISDVFGEHHVRANPFERGKSLSWLAAWAAKKMGSKSAKAPPPQQLASTKDAKTQGPVAAPAKTTKDAESPVVANAKPGEKKPADQTQQVADNKHAGTGPAEPATQVAMTRFDSNPSFTKLKDAVAVFLQ